MGYDFNTAVADIVDNSIEAEANNIWITVKFEGAASWVTIADDGAGMDAKTLVTAMTYGAERDYDVDSLGRFGLGLKTASTSQCRCLTVASRTNPRRGTIAIRQWDLDYIDRSNDWDLIILERQECPLQLLAPLQTHTGTVVLWERLDRIIEYKHPEGEAARKRILQMCRELESHLRMVFHRFLDGSARKGKLKIFINGNQIEPWDPFARGEPNTQALDALEFQVPAHGAVSLVRFEPYILPHRSRFSTIKAFEDSTGPDKWNRQQGFYIYRADRMIQSGGWCGLRTLDEHTKLARIALSFSPKLDAEFKINVAKMRVHLPAELRKSVEEALAPIIRAAQLEYRQGGKEGAGIRGGENSPVSRAQPVRKPHQNGHTPDYGSSHGPSDSNTWTLTALRDRLMAVANEKEQQVLRRLFERLDETLGGSRSMHTRKGDVE
jgi:hypothetical protein